MKQDYTVVFTVVSEHKYTIRDCNSPEEAESIAEQYFAEGEDGEVLSQDIQDTISEESEEDSEP